MKRDLCCRSVPGILVCIDIFNLVPIVDQEEKTLVTRVQHFILYSAGGGWAQGFAVMCCCVIFGVVFQELLS